MKEVSYQNVRLSELKVEKGLRDYFLYLNDKKYKLSKRFWSSLNRRYNLNHIIYNYFSPEETFDRIVKAKGDHVLRLAIENDSQILGLSEEKKRIIEFNECIDWLSNQNATKIHYNKGVIDATFQKDENNPIFQIGGDEFKHQYNVRIPVDGVGTPNFFVSLYRLICSNGMMGFNKAFATPVNLDRVDPISTLERATSNFKNEEGFGKLENKLLESQSAALSLSEAKKVKNLLEKTECGSFELSKYLKLVNLNYYGSKEVDKIGKLGHSLPCTNGIDIVSVYDVINFLTELSTHKAGDHERDRINGLVGQILSQDFDLPSMIEENVGFEGLFLNEDIHKSGEDL